MSQHCLLDLLLEPGSLSVLFQPILEAQGLGSWGLHSLECLTRGPVNTNLEPANILFEYVRLKRKENLFDRVCVAQALRSASNIKLAGMSVLSGRPVFPPLEATSEAASLLLPFLAGD